MRRQGVGDLGEVRYAILEQRGELSVIRATGQGGPEPDLVREVVARASPSA